MTFSFYGIGERAVSFSDGGTTDGYPCLMSANGQVQNADAGEDFFGVTIYQRDEAAAVQVKGYVELDYTGQTAPILGWCGLCADGEGGVSYDADGHQFLVVSVDGGRVGFFL